MVVYEYPDGARKKIWLKKVKRKGTWEASYGDLYWTWEYKEIKKLDK